MSRPQPQVDESTLAWVLRQLGKPAGAVAGAVDSALTGVDDPLARVWGNLSGDREDRWDDVLANQGMAPGWQRSALGFVGDVVADPLNLVPLGAGTKALGALGRRARYATHQAEALPLVGGLAKAGNTALDATGNVLGSLFDPWHGVRDVPGYKTARRLYDSERMALQANVADDVFRRYEGLSPDQQTQLTDLLEAGVESVPDPRLNAALQAQRQRYAELGDQLVEAKVLAPGQLRPNYAPHIFRWEDPWDEVLGIKHEFRTVSAKDPFANPRTGDANFEKNAARAALIREHAGQKALLGSRFIRETFQRYGRTLSDELASGAPDATAAARGLAEKGYVPASKVSAMLPLKVEAADLWLPKDVAVDLLQVHQPRPDPSAAKQAIDKVMQTWRTLATVVRPGFHATNLQGNLYNAVLQGQDLSSLTRHYTAAIPGGTLPDLGGLTGKDLEAYLRRHGLGHGTGEAFGHEFVPQQLDELLAEKLAGTLNAPSAWRTPLKSYVRAMRGLGNAVETTSKRAFFLDALEKQLAGKAGAQVANEAIVGAKTLTPEDLDTALLKTYDALFNYRELTRTEHDVLRNIFPFYTWMRKNVPLQLRGLVDNPKVPAALGKLQDTLEGQAEQQGILTPDTARPDYLTDDGAIQLPFTLQNGSRVYWTPFLPAQDLNKLPLPMGSSLHEVFAEVLAGLTPGAKVPVEFATNTNLLTGQPKYNPQLGILGDWQPAPELLQALPEGAAGALGLRADDGRYYAPAATRLLNDLIPVAGALGKAGQQFTRPESLGNPLALSSILGGVRLTARTPEQEQAGAKTALSRAKRLAAILKRQQQLQELPDGLSGLF